MGNNESFTHDTIEVKITIEWEEYNKALAFPEDITEQNIYEMYKRLAEEHIKLIK